LIVHITTIATKALPKMTEEALCASSVIFNVQQFETGGLVNSYLWKLSDS